ncbi:MAG: type II secretion system secretin GspD [Rhodospirillales bacterium]|nr:type II secretion system secretin GspD [Rhodospirillales bacterium]
MAKGEPAINLARIMAQLLLCGVLLMAPSCTPRPFFDQTTKSPRPAVTTEAVPDEVGAAEALPQPESTSRPAPVGGIYRGTDSFVRRGAPTGRGAIRTPQGEVTLNFVDADLREVVKAILGDTLGANFVMDPQVQGTVTLQTSDPMPGNALVSVLESILAVNNAVLVESGGIYKVVPADQGVRGSGGIRSALASASQSPGAQVLAVPLRHVSATEVEKILAPFAPPGGVLRVDPRRQVVVIGGSRSEVSAMLDVIDTFDVDWLAGMSFGLFPIRSTSSKTMVDELEKVFGDQAEGPLSGVVRFVPIERLNAVLVISPRSMYVDRARTWIDRLDVGENESPRLYVYYCENSRAEDLAGVLSQVFGQQQGAGQRPTAQLAPGLSPVTMEGQAAEAPGNAPPTPLGASPQRTEQRVGGGASQRAGGDAGVQVGGGSDSIRIIADKVKNALVIMAKPSDYRTVESALRRLDIVPLQVLIEATILEVTLNDALRYGVEWFFKFGSQKLSLSDAGLGRISSPSNSVANAIFPGFSYILSPTDSVKVVVNALDSVSDVNVVSSPQIFVLDNQTATLTVGDQVPITTRSLASPISSTTADAFATSNSIEYRDTGVILNVTPRVNAGGLVTMEISQEVSDVRPVDTDSATTTESQATSPTISQRKVETTVAVQGGETVALGGLITDNRTDSSTGLPYLSRLPVIGWLFGTKRESAARTELLVLITPRVVGSMEQARQVTQELRSRLQTIAPLEERIR